MTALHAPFHHGRPPGRPPSKRASALKNLRANTQEEESLLADAHSWVAGPEAGHGDDQGGLQRHPLPQYDIKRAFAAVAAMGVAHVGDEVFEIAFAQPAWRHHFQPAARAAREFHTEGCIGDIFADAFSRDHENEPERRAPAHL